MEGRFLASKLDVFITVLLILIKIYDMTIVGNNMTDYLPSITVCAVAVNLWDRNIAARKPMEPV